MAAVWSVSYFALSCRRFRSSFLPCVCLCLRVCVCVLCSSSSWLLGSSFFIRVGLHRDRPTVPVWSVCNSWQLCCVGCVEWSRMCCISCQIHTVARRKWAHRVLRMDASDSRGFYSRWFCQWHTLSVTLLVLLFVIFWGWRVALYLLLVLDGLQLLAIWWYV